MKFSYFLYQNLNAKYELQIVYFQDFDEEESYLYKIFNICVFWYGEQVKNFG